MLIPFAVIGAVLWFALVILAIALCLAGTGGEAPIDLESAAPEPPRGYLPAGFSRAPATPVTVSYTATAKRQPA